MTINKVTQQSKKYRSKKGGVTFEFFLVTAILVIFLNYLFDIAQRVGQFSWLQQIAYVTSKFGSETSEQAKEFYQSKWIKTNVVDKNNNNQRFPYPDDISHKDSLVDIHNDYWRLKSFQDSRLESSNRSLESLIDYIKITGKSSRLWRPSILDHNSFEMKMPAFVDNKAVTTNSISNTKNLEIKINGVTNTIIYDFCGRVCKDDPESCQSPLKDCSEKTKS